MKLPLLSSWLLALAAFGCQSKCHDPQPTCYNGIVLGDTCQDGILIDVDPRYPIGQALYGPDQPGVYQRASNVIAMVNTEDFGRPVRPGERVYFTRPTNPPGRCGTMSCVLNIAPLTVPHEVLANISTVACGKEEPE